MKNLVIVEASGKADFLRAKLKSINLKADVIATVGHIAANPRSLADIALDSGLRETQYRFKDNRISLLEKIERMAGSADRIFLAMDDDQEGDVIAYDLSWVLNEYASKLQRVRLRAITEVELERAFGGELERSFEGRASNGICRRIVDRAIGGTFSQVGEDMVAVGRVQSSLLLHIQDEPPEVGRYVFTLPLPQGLAVAEKSVVNKAELTRLDAMAKLVLSGRTPIVEDVVVESVSSEPWGYDEIIDHVSDRLQISIADASIALQEAYERGRVSYPRAKKNGYTDDAASVCAAIGKNNRTQFNPALLPRRSTDDKSAHECPRSLDGDLMLGRPFAVMDLPDAVAVLVARNVMACGQLTMKRVLKTVVDDDVLSFSIQVSKNLRNWKEPDPVPGYHPFSNDRAMLRYMAQRDLGRPSTVVGHIIKFLDRGLVVGDGDLSLSAKGKRWAERATDSGFTKNTSAEMERMFDADMSDPHVAAKNVLVEHGMFDAVQAAIERKRKISNFENLSNSM